MQVTASGSILTALSGLPFQATRKAAEVRAEGPGERRAVGRLWQSPQLKRSPRRQQRLSSPLPPSPPEVLFAAGSSTKVLSPRPQAAVTLAVISRTDVAEVLVQIPKWWGSHHRNIMLFPQKSFKIAPREIKA